MIFNSKYRGIIIGNIWNDNKAAFSQLSNFSHAGVSPANVIGIKFVIKGCENYTLNQKTYSVKDDCFLLVNPNQKIEVSLNILEPTTGLCFNIEKKVLADVYNNYRASDEMLLDRSQVYAFDLTFPETVYRPGDHFSQYLSSLRHFVDPLTGGLAIEKEPLFYNLAKNMLLAQSLIRKQTLQIKANKRTTREELFKRMNEARSIIDDSVLKTIHIADLAASVA